MVTLTGGQGNHTLDAGLYRPAKIGGDGDLVFSDLNGNEIRDNGESGVANVTLRLLDANGNVVATANTGTTGIYNFSGLAPGRYQIEFMAHPGTQFSARDAGGDDALDSDVDTASGRTTNFTLASDGIIESLGGRRLCACSIGWNGFCRYRWQWHPGRE